MLTTGPSGSREIRWSPVRSLWLVLMYACAALWAAPTLSLSALLVFLGLSAVLLCLGFSVGLHRGIIHRSFRMGKPLERSFIYLAALNGFGGVQSLIRMHELRDIWQNQNDCPEYFAYRHGLFRDYIWYLHMEYRGAAGPGSRLLETVARDPFYAFLQRTWMVHPVLLGALLYLAGGWPFVVWGLFVRIAVTLTGVWLVNYAAHRHGYRSFEIEGSVEQGGNSLLFGAISMGEGWHNTHHAFPDSARIGLKWWEIDPGYLSIRVLERLGLVWDVRTPDWRLERTEVDTRAGRRIVLSRRTSPGISCQPR